MSEGVLVVNAWSTFDVRAPIGRSGLSLEGRIPVLGEPQDGKT